MRFLRSLCHGVTVHLIVCLGVAAPAWATIDNFKSFKEAYPGKEPKAYSCKVCHQGAIGKKGDLNAYGISLQKLKAPADAKKLMVDDYRAIEAEDADADSATNLQEFEAGTDISDPASIPEGITPPVTTPEETSEETSEDDAGEGVEEEQKPEEPGATEEHVHPSTDAPSSQLPTSHSLQAYLSKLVMQTAWASEGTSSSDTTETVAEYVGTETCASCHAKEFKEFQHSTHARIAIPGDNVKAQGCEMCHGPGSLHVEAGGGRGVGGIINPRKDPSTCFECHLDKKAEFRLPYHHPLMEGKMSCADCHDAHAPDVRPWSATSLKDINEACFKCHKDQRGPFVWEHEALREGCTTCHKVHGSIHDKMLLARDNNLCLRCHTQANFPTIGKSGHGGRLPSGTCFSAGCHTAVHGSNFDDHLRY